MLCINEKTKKINKADLSLGIKNIEKKSRQVSVLCINEKKNDPNESSRNEIMHLQGNRIGRMRKQKNNLHVYNAVHMFS